MATAQEIDSRLLRALRDAPLPNAGLPAAALAGRLALDEPALAAGRASTGCAKRVTGSTPPPAAAASWPPPRP